MLVTESEMTPGSPVCLQRCPEQHLYSDVREGALSSVGACPHAPGAEVCTLHTETKELSSNSEVILGAIFKFREFSS